MHCMSCSVTSVDLGKARYFNESSINKEIPKETQDKVILAVTRFNVSITQVDFFGDGFKGIEYYNEIIEFMSKHVNHKLFLIDDYFKEDK